MASGRPSSRRQSSATDAGVLGRQGEGRRHQPGALDEEPDGLGPARRSGAQLVLVRQRERRHPERALARDVEALAAGRQHREPGTARGAAPRRAPRTPRPRARSCRDEQERLAARERGGERSRGGRDASSCRPSADATRLRHEPRVRHRGQLDEPDAVRIALPELRARRQGEPGLADAACAEERHAPDARPGGGRSRGAPAPGRSGS